MSDIQPVMRMEMLLDGVDLDPVTREEMICAGVDLEPVTRREYFIKKAVEGGSTPTGTINITENGEHDVTNYATANVAIPEPTGTVPISTNGTHDVTAYEYASVNIPDRFPDGQFIAWTHEVIEIDANTISNAAQVFAAFEAAITISGCVLAIASKNFSEQNNEIALCCLKVIIDATWETTKYNGYRYKSSGSSFSTISSMDSGYAAIIPAGTQFDVYAIQFLEVV